MLGNQTHEPELHHTPTGIPACEFSSAVHYRYRVDDKNKEEFLISASSWLGQLGERNLSEWPVAAAAFRNGAKERRGANTKSFATTARFLDSTGRCGQAKKIFLPSACKIVIRERGN